jgi:hypothetical protein
MMPLLSVFKTKLSGTLIAPIALQAVSGGEHRKIALNTFTFRQIPGSRYRALVQRDFVEIPHGQKDAGG